MSEQRKKTKYIVYAKILGDFLPERKVKIGECHIEKTTAFLERDLPEIPIIEKRSASHSLSKGVDAFIHYPQQPVSIRTFESSYLVSTEISEENLYFVLKEAEDRFTDLIASLSLALKTTTQQLGKKRIRRQNYFDYEIVGIFLKVRGRLIRISPPAPLINVRNFFPKDLPNGFLAKSKRYLACTDRVFRRCIKYITIASRNRYTGNFNTLEIALNFIKCIELISASIDRRKSTSDHLINSKDRMIFTGKLLKVRKSDINMALKAWDFRNKGDIAHGTDDGGFWNISLDAISEASNAFLRKYFAYIDK